MKNEIATSTRIENGKITHPELIEGLLIRAAREYNGERVEVRISVVSGKRSFRQNRYYWGVVVECVQDCLRSSGHTLSAEETHEFLKVKFLDGKKMFDPETGAIIQLPATTTKMKKDEFGEYIDKIKQWTLEIFGAFIPEPNEDL